MNQALLYGSVLKRFARYKLKTFLLMLGVTVGVYVLTTGLALGSGFKTAVMDYFSRIFLPNSITLASESGAPDARPLSEADVAALLDAIPALVSWTPLMPGGRADLERNGATQRAGIMAVSPAAQQVIGQSAVLGTYLSDADIATRSRVVLLGNTVKEKLFGGEDPLGQPLALGSQVFVVKGVLNRLGADPHGGDLDNVVVIPYTTQLQTNKRDDLVSVRFRVGSSSEMASAAAAMSTILRARHNITEGRQDDFYVSTMPAGQAMFLQFEATFRILLPVITGVLFVIALLVIASLMLISVKERTAEIGLRKAVGASARDVEQQFMVEIVLVAVLGGVLGIALSYPGLLYIESLYARYGSAVSFLPTPAMLALSLLCAVLTGALAALLPARRAAALAPVEALR